MLGDVNALLNPLCNLCVLCASVVNIENRNLMSRSFISIRILSQRLKVTKCNSSLRPERIKKANLSDHYLGRENLFILLHAQDV